MADGEQKRFNNAMVILAKFLNGTEINEIDYDTIKFF